MEHARVRRLGGDEGLLAAALHVQALRAAGTAPPPGHLDRFAARWQAAGKALPTWVAERARQHTGVLVARVPPPLPPLVGPAGRGTASVELLYAAEEGVVEQTTLALLRAALEWAEDSGLDALDLAAGVTAPPAVLDALDARLEEVRRVSLPTRRRTR